MSIRDFLAKHRFKSHSAPVNSWDSFREDGTALMQLWDRDRTMVNDPLNPEHYMRVRCWDARNFADEGKNEVVGYLGRREA
jgi:hypothetical protein